MLYDLWRQLAASRSSELALRDCATGRQWTFGQLAVAAEAWPAEAGLVFPAGNSPEFILAVLATWRIGGVVCPLESDQTVPVIPRPGAACCHLKSTSATGGVARFVVFTAPQLAADAANIVTTMGLRPDWPNLGVISLAHSYGFSNLVLPLLLHGVPLLLVHSPLPEPLRRAAEGAGEVVLPAVPALWRAWHTARAIPPHVRLAISAGAALPLPLEQEVFAATGLKLHNFYGSSECGGIAYDRGEVPREDPALAGTLLTGVTATVATAGSLVVTSSAVGESYWPDCLPGLGAGTFLTSDLVELRKDQVLLRGRVGDQINIGGRKLSPETVEQALLNHPRVRECLVFGTASGQAGRGEAMVAVVVGNAAAAELREFLLDTLPAWQVPREWRFVNALAPNQRGKLSRADWRRQFERGSL